MSSPGNSYSFRSSRTSISTRSNNSGSSTISVLFRNTTMMRGTFDLASKQYVLTSLRHRARQLAATTRDCAIHLGSTGDHVFHVVSVARTVNVCVVTCFRLVLDVRNSDRHRLGFVTLCTTLGDVFVRNRRCQSLSRAEQQPEQQSDVVLPWSM